MSGSLEFAGRTHDSVRPLEPRATRLHVPGHAGAAAQIWMGGTDSLLGEPLTLSDAGTAHIVDLAGDLPEPYRVGSWRYTPRVFMDAEQVPHSYPRLAALVHDLAGAISGHATSSSANQPQRIYVLCKYGMNRSGLVAGLLLRALGVSATAAVADIRAARPGALSNETYVALIERWMCPQL